MVLQVKWLVSRGGAELLTESIELRPATGAKETEVAHFDKAFRQDVLKESADELFSAKGAGLDRAGVGGAVAEGDLAIV